MSNTIGYRGTDCPVSIDGTFVIRVQSADFERRLPATPVGEMGRFAPVGITQDNYRYIGRLVQNTVANTELEDMFAGTTDPSLEDYKDADGVTVMGPYGGISGAKVMSVQYEISAGAGAAKTTINFEGTGWTSGSIVTPAVDTDYPGAYSGGDIVATVGTQVYRAQRVMVQGNLAREQLNEIGNADPVGFGYDSPTVTCEIELVHSDYAQPTMWNADPDSPVTIGIAYDTDVKTLSMTNMVSDSQPTSGNIRGWATIRYRFTSKTGTLTIG